jgi:HEAT repeat protein
VVVGWAGSSAAQRSGASSHQAASRVESRGSGATLASRPRNAWDSRDPADSLYREGQAALDRGQFTRAATLFQRIHERYPNSTYAADSYYWQAFALYRTNQSENMRRGLALLEEQKSRHPRAATIADAGTLATRIRGELARRGDSGAAEKVVTQARAQDCVDPDQDDRIEALNALLQMDADRALPILRRVLERRDPCSLPLRRKAIFLVSQKRSPETEDILLASLRNDPDREVREQAVFWLSQVNTEKALDALVDILRTSTDVEIQKKALFALSQHRSPRGSETLREVASRDNTPNELRREAIFFISQNRRAENAQFLRELYGRLTDSDLKERVLFSVSQMKSQGNDSWLMDIATNSREPVEMRKKALFWAGQGGVSIDPLVDLYGRMNDREMREQLIFVYSQRKETKAVDKLMDIAKNEQDRELRKKAIFWLSQSRDPRAAQFLEEIITRP